MWADTACVGVDVLLQVIYWKKKRIDEIYTRNVTSCGTVLSSQNLGTQDIQQSDLMQIDN